MTLLTLLIGLAIFAAMLALEFIIATGGDDPDEYLH